MQVVEAGGARIPAIGLGTWELRGRVCARLVEQALKLGYRHIDTAQAYDNEREVGEALRASGVRRDDVFVTTKVWTTHFAPNDLERSTKESLAKLRLGEVDLLLLHWPNPQVPLVETLGALARVKQLGMRSFGSGGDGGVNARAPMQVNASLPALSCVDDLAGESVETACEGALFASPDSVAAAVSYAASQVSSLTAFGDVSAANKVMTPELQALRRAVERDRYGLVAHGPARQEQLPLHGVVTIEK